MLSSNTRILFRDRYIARIDVTPQDQLLTVQTENLGASSLFNEREKRVWNIACLLLGTEREEAMYGDRRTSRS